MQPYYQHAGITIYHGDCTELVATLPRGLMVTDPPYNIGYHYHAYHDRRAAGDYWTWLQAVLRPPVIVIHYPEQMFPLSRALGCDPQKVVAWVYHGNRQRQYRSLAWFGTAPDLSLVKQPYKDPYHKRVRDRASGGCAIYDWWHIEQVKAGTADKTAHPCQIPIVVMTRMLQTTPTPDTVLDPFCGSGTTLLAAKRLGRPAIGIELEERYCEVAASRLAQEVLPFAAAG